MPDREISHPGRATEVTIPEHASSRAKQIVRLRLAPGAAQEYSVWQKELPGNLPESYQGMTISWFNNFGLKRAGSDRYEAKVPPYTIILDPGPSGSILVYYDELSELPLNRLETTEVEGKLHATLDQGDPAIGWVT
jgi:hypothetical protein